MTKLATNTRAHSVVKAGIVERGKALVDEAEEDGVSVGIAADAKSPVRCFFRTLDMTSGVNLLWAHVILFAIAIII